MFGTAGHTGGWSVRDNTGAEGKSLCQMGEGPQLNAPSRSLNLFVRNRQVLKDMKSCHFGL